MNRDDEETPDILECDDCGIKGEGFFEDIGLQKYELNVYWDLGEPDRCEDCFVKWKSGEYAEEFLNEVKKMEQEQEQDEDK